MPALAQEAPLRAALSRDVAPFEMTGPDGRPDGFSVDLFSAVAARLHRPVSFAVLPRTDLLGAVTDGRADLVATPVTVSPELTGQFIFTTGYMWTQFQFAALKGGPTPQAPEELRGHVVVASEGTPYAVWAARNAERDGFTLRTAASNDAALADLVAGRAELMLAASPTLRFLATREPRLVPGLSVPETRTAWAAPLRRTDVELRDAVDDAIDCLKVDGTIASLSRKWFGIEPAPTDLERVVSPGHGVPGLSGYDPTARPPRC